MTSFLHISDLHIGQATAIYRVKNLVDHIIKNEEKQVIVLTGDVTDNGSQIEYDEALEMLRPLTDAGFVVFAVPGNHDCGIKGISHNLTARWRFDSFLHELTGPKLTSRDYPYVYRLSGIQFVLCDSTVEARRLAAGALGYTQRQRLARDLEQGQAAGLINVVAFHHHPFDRGFGLELDDADEVLATLSLRCDILLFGHKHQAAEWSQSYGIKRLIAADKTPDSGRYRRITIEADKRITQQWVVFTPQA